MWCKGKKQEIENKEQKVPEMIEIEVDASTTPQNHAIVPDAGKYVICKLYGTVKTVLCENCKTYKCTKWQAIKNNHIMNYNVIKCNQPIESCSEYSCSSLTNSSQISNILSLFSLFS